MAETTAAIEAIEAVPLRLVLDLQVVRGSRWRELAPFREAVLCHFASPALRANLAVLAEALADQLLELEGDAVEAGEATDASEATEPWPKARFRALVADLRHSREGLAEVVSNVLEEESPADRPRWIEAAAELLRALTRGLSNAEELLGAPPELRDPR